MLRFSRPNKIASHAKPGDLLPNQLTPKELPRKKKRKMKKKKRKTRKWNKKTKYLNVLIFGIHFSFWWIFFCWLVDQKWDKEKNRLKNQLLLWHYTRSEFKFHGVIVVFIAL